LVAARTARPAAQKKNSTIRRHQPLAPVRPDRRRIVAAPSSALGLDVNEVTGFMPVR